MPPLDTAGQVQGRPPGFAPRLDVGLAYDDNLFSRPDASFDTILRISPAVALYHETPKVRFSTQYAFDAERYQDYTDLSSPFVRQNASADLLARPGTKTTFALRGGYGRTQTPTDLNLTTGLVTVRQLASLWNVGTEIVRTTGPRGTVTFGYDYSQNDIATPSATDTLSHVGTFGATRRVTVRDEIEIGLRAEHYVFTPGRSATSHVGTMGWTRHLSPASTLTLSGGPRMSAGAVRPEVSVTIDRRVGDLATFSAGYSRSQTVAVGVDGLVEVDAVSAGVVVRRVDAWELDLSGGGFRNVLGATEVRALDASVEFRRAISRRVWVVAHASGTRNWNDTGGILPVNERVSRNVLVLSLRLAPGSAR